MIIFAGLFSNMVNAQTGWILQTNPLGTGENAMIGKVQFVSATEGWISGSRGDLLHTTDAGNNWTVVTPFPSDTVSSSSDPAVSMTWVNQSHGWKINSIGADFGNTNGAVIHRTTDGGSTWQKKVISTSAGDFGFQIQFVDENNGWALVYNFTTFTPTFLKTSDGGNNWIPFNGAGIFYFVNANVGYSFTSAGPSGTLVPYKIFKTTNGGNDWTEQFVDFSPGHYNTMHFSDTENGWVVADSGKVLKTTNGGVNWNFVTNSGVNQQSGCKAVFFLDANNGWISSKASDNEQTPFVVHTTDGGATWTTQNTPLGNQFGSNAIFSIYFADSQTGWLTADNGKICRYNGLTSADNENIQVNSFSLSQNYPNPFNPSTRINYSVAQGSRVTIRVFDILGNEIEVLVDEEKSVGNFAVNWNASAMPAGIYFYKLSAGSFTETKKMILMK